MKPHTAAKSAPGHAVLTVERSRACVGNGLRAAALWLAALGSAIAQAQAPQARAPLVPADQVETQQVKAPQGQATLARSASARGLPDPTRPPAALYQPSGTAAPESSTPRLQSVLVAPDGGRRVAVINGQTLRVGDKFQGAVLTSVTDTEAVLVQGRQRQVLKLSQPAPSPATIR